MDQKTSTTQEEDTIPVWKLMLERNARLKVLLMEKQDHVAKESPSKCLENRPSASEWLENGLAEKISTSRQ